MVSFVFSIAILNLLLGFGLAVYFRYMETVPQFASPAPAPIVAEQPREVKISNSKTIHVEKNKGGKKPAEVVEEIPQEWLETLKSVSIEASSFVEASVQVLKLEVGRYREQLLSIEDQVRICSTSFDKQKIHELLIELKELNEGWLEKQADAADHLSDRRGNLGDFEDSGGALEDILLDQAAQIETTCNNIGLLDFERDVEAGCKRLIIEIGRLVDLAHTLRDRMQDSIVAILQAEKRLDSIDRKLQTDNLTTLPNRIGLEVMFEDWWKEDMTRQRLVSVGLIDIDRFAKLNEHFSTRSGDKIIGAFGRLLEEIMRKDRGFERAARYAGQSFLLFFGDTGPRNATSAVERIRQTIAATTFDYDGTEMELTISCAVTEVAKNDTTRKLFKRLKIALRAAKKAGRNQTTLDEGTGPQAVEPPQFQVKGRVVRVTDDY